MLLATNTTSKNIHKFDFRNYQRVKTTVLASIVSTNQVSKLSKCPTRVFTYMQSLTQYTFLSKLQTMSEEVPPAVVSPFISKVKRRRDDSDDEDEDGKSRTMNRCGVIVCKNKSKHLNGFVVYIDGYAEKAMTHAFYNRNEKSSKKFMRTVGAMHHVFKLKETKGSDTRLRKNSRSFPYKALVILTGDEVDKSVVIEYVNKTLIPSVLSVDSVPIGPKSHPELDTDFEQVTTWDQVLTKSDIKWLIREYSASYTDSKMAAATFLKKDVNNVGAFWAPGTTPEDIIDDFDLGPKHLPQP